MKNTTLFIVAFLITLLVISSAPAYLYLNNLQDSEPWNPEGSEPVLLSKFSSHQELTTYLETSSSL
ncbi:hypothetical protein MUO71_00675, partial [Candidatus Bathyarchaeota archaeon]|nr:hypothetical protein [Candidatus Bathyarchaeota archaeon]